MKTRYQGIIMNKSYFSDKIKGRRDVYLPNCSLSMVDFDRINQCIMYLIIQYAYTLSCDYGKLSVGYVMSTPQGSVRFTIGKAITFKEKGENIPVYDLIAKLVSLAGERYKDSVLDSLFIYIYYIGGDTITIPKLSHEEIVGKVSEWIEKPYMSPKEVHKISHSTRKPKDSTELTVLKRSTLAKNTQPFIVADTETVLVDNVHVPYAVGFLVVMPGDDLSSKPYGKIETYFSEEYEVKYQGVDSFSKRSKQMFYDFIERLVIVCNQNILIRTVYFHNLSRFDGRIILHHLVGLEMYTFKPLIRNGNIYSISVYLRKSKKLLFRLVDSLHLLTGSLDSLSQNLCPELGMKGIIEYDKINVSNLKILKVDYMKQDILLLGGVVLKAQEIYWSIFKIDIVTKLTLSSLSLSIFRMHYFDQKNWSIHIPTRNEDTFIRGGFYGGHTDVYNHEGENLYHYDVNSLYPYIMKTFPMPGGKPQWKDNLEKEDNLDNLFGFIEAYVECPKTMKRPFLPYREKNKDTLIFPTGSWIGVYYSEELKYARDIGYKIIPLKGYLFDNKNSTPFGNFVDVLFKYRQEAKKAGNSDLSYIYKILMNSLYGRFGINPISMITEICDEVRYLELLKKDGFCDGERLNDRYYYVVYSSNTEKDPDCEWNPPRISAVQLAAAITACARIHMYPYISRDDCYYTDTDSVFLGSPLPESDVDSTLLGKFKLEGKVKKVIFLAPKSYCLVTEQNECIIKQKGVAKDYVDAEWFELQLKDPSRITEISHKNNFINDKLRVLSKDSIFKLGIKMNNKRISVQDTNKKLLYTIPKHIKSLDKRIIQILNNKDNKIEKLNYEIEN